MITALKTLFNLGPLLFAFGFIAPLTQQVLARFGPAALADGYTPLLIGLTLAAVWGGFAQYKGRWV